MQKALELFGQRFGRLVVVGLAGKAKRANGMLGGRLWECKCDCGNPKNTTASSLVRKTHGVRSCGCLRMEANSRTKHSKRPYEALYNGFVQRARRSQALNKKISISYEEFLEFANQKYCHYCGSKVTWTEFNINNGRSAAYNLDRKNNDLGYSKDNCTVCCNDCNRGKGARYSYEEWSVMTDALRKFRKERTNEQS